MDKDAEKQKDEGKPDLLRHYRPVGIRSVVAAQAMIPRPRPDATFEETAPEMGFALPAGFHSPPED